MERKDMTGIIPTVEYRPHCGKFFVTYPEIDVELAPVFDNRTTAFEIAEKTFLGTPFFQMIPVVAYGCSYPRPNTLVPRPRDLNIALVIGASNA